MKMGVIECTIFLGIVLGTVSSSYIFTFTSYEVVFSLGAICCLVGFIFTIYCIPESIANQESEVTFRCQGGTQVVHSVYCRVKSKSCSVCPTSTKW